MPTDKIPPLGLLSDQKVFSNVAEKKMDVGAFSNKKRFGYNEEGFVIPLITLTDDISDDDDDDNYSIEELENAVFSETEDGIYRYIHLDR